MRDYYRPSSYFKPDEDLINVLNTLERRKHASPFQVVLNTAVLMTVLVLFVLSAYQFVADFKNYFGWVSYLVSSILLLFIYIDACSIRMYLSTYKDLKSISPTKASLEWVRKYATELELGMGQIKAVEKLLK